MKRLWRPVLVNFLLFSALLWVLDHFYHAQQERYFQTESAMLQQQLEDRFQLYFRGAHALQGMAEEFWKRPVVSPKEFSAIGASVLNNFPEVLGANFLDADGRITLVYPDTEINRRALGRVSQNTQALRASLQRGEELWLSPPFELFQGGPGFAYYLSLSRQGRHLGWYGIVISQAKFRSSFVKDGLGFHFKVRDRASGLDYFATEAIPEDEPLLRTRELRVLGRPVVISTWPREHLPYEDQNALIVFFDLILTSLGTLAWAMYAQRRESKRQLADLNQLLRLIIHDTANGLTVLRLQLELMRTQPQLVPINKLARHVEFIVELLEQIRLVRQLSESNRHWDTVARPALGLLQKVSDPANERLSERSQALDYDPELLAKSKIPVSEALWAHSVLLNLLYLASKLAPEGATIKLRTGRRERETSLWIEAERCEGQIEKGDELSLSIAKKVMELHRGELVVHALTPGKLALEIRFLQ